MSVIVFAWLDSDSGHAALSIDGHEDVRKRDPFATYVSFYPDPRRVDVENTSLKKLVFTGVPGTPTTMGQNLHSDNGLRKRVPSFASAPINGLDELAIIRFWADFRSKSVTWSLTKNSCADVVFKALDAGGASKKSTVAAALIALARHQFVLVRDCVYLAQALED